MRVTVAGCGYVGIVTAATHARFGHEVTGYDVSPERVSVLAAGECPVYEPGLAELVAEGVASGRLTFRSEPPPPADVTIVCVGTPSGATGAADLTAMWGAIAALDPAGALCIKSTVPPGTADRVAREFGSDGRPILSVPEFLAEGSAVRDALRPDRIVLGGPYVAAVHDLYRPLVRTEDQIKWLAQRSSAELVKYGSNALLATRIALVNELARLADVVDADMGDVRAGIGADARIGSAFLYAGAGYGGSCFKKDLDALAAMGTEHGLELDVVTAAVRSNVRHRHWLLSRVPVGVPVCVWGLAFKPGTDDVRDAPGVWLVRALVAAGSTVSTYDPQAAISSEDLGAPIHSSPYRAAAGAGVLLLATEWPELRSPDWNLLAEQMVEPRLVIDGRNVWSPRAVTAAGLRYVGVGRSTPDAGGTIATSTRRHG